MAVHFKSQYAPKAQMFPQKPQFSAFMKPCRFEGEVNNLEIEGSIPPEIDGTFYRVMPDPQLPPLIENDPWFNGDGNISAFRIKDGHCHFKQRYVRTEKFMKEHAAQKALLGKYRNRYTDAIEFQIRSTANTNVFYFNGRLLACKEDSPPYSVDPDTLETYGVEDFNGQLPSLTFTAHPKLDQATGDLVCFGYEARGDGTPDVCYFVVSPEGVVTETAWVVAPVVAMIHDFAVAENWVLFPIIPLTNDVERLKAGGEHWQWDPKTPFYLGVIPRHGATGASAKWFRAPNAFPGHIVNAYEDEAGRLVIDLAHTDRNVFFWWPDAEGNAPDPQTIKARLVRYTFDPRSDSLELPEPEILVVQDCEFPRIDDRVSMKKHTKCFFDMMDPSLGTDFAAVMPNVGGGYPLYNSLGLLDYTTGKLASYFPGKTHMVQEPVFINRPGDAPEGDGWLMVLVNNYRTMASELHIVDTRDPSRAQAVVYLPLKLRAGLHGNWVDAKDMKPPKIAAKE